MIEEIVGLENVTIEDVTLKLDELIQEKSEALNTLNVAVNDYVAAKNEYVVKSNKLRISTDFKAEMKLSKAATEKQQQAYIDNELCALVQDIRIAEENIKVWKREVDLLNDKITVEKMRVNLLMRVIDGINEP